MVEAEPLAVGVQRDEEHRLPLQLLEDELGVRLTGQMTDQLRAHLVQHRDLQEELTPIVRLGLEDLLAEVVGDQSVVSAELGDELVGVLVEPEGHPGQLQPGGPSFGPCHQGGHAVGPQGPPGDLLEQKGRVDVIEGQVGLADLDQLLGEPMAAPGDGEIGPGRQDQMDVGREAVDQAAEVGEEHRVGQVVQVVEDDDHFGELGQLGLERLQQWRSEPAAVQGHQRGEIGEVRVDGGEPLQQALGEADGIVVVGADLHPDEVQLRMGGGPLGEENRLAGAGRSHDEGRGGGRAPRPAVA